MRTRSHRLTLLVIVATLVVGCSTSPPIKEDPNAGKPMAQRQDDMIKKIQDNPNMPESAKQMAISAVKGNGHRATR